MCDWGKACERGSLLSGDMSEFRQFSDPHRVGHWADARNKTQDVGGVCKALIGCDRLFGLGFKLRNLVIQRLFQRFVYGLEQVGRARFPMRLDLSLSPLSCHDGSTAL